jgi:methionyl-tRNA formyltransferase
LHEVLPSLLAGTAPRLKNDLSLGGYFGGRKAADGRINLSQNTQQIYNLIRAVAPPYPGAYLESPGQPNLWIDGAQPVRDGETRSILERQALRTEGPLTRWQGQSYLRGSDGAWLRLKLRK